VTDRPEQLAAVLHPDAPNTASAYTFAARCELADLLEAAQLAPLSAAHGARAQALQGQIELADERFFARVRSRIAARRFTPGGLAESLRRYAESSADPRRYDALDVLLSGVLDAGELPVEHVAREAEMIAYQPTPGRVVLSLLPHIQADDVVYDLGAGLGRVVLVAALLRGVRARGVEIEPAFCAYADCVARALRIERVDFVVGDAREVPLDDGTLFFMYSPFRGELLGRVMSRLRGLATRTALRICSLGPCTAALAAAPWLQLHCGTLAADELNVFHSIYSGERLA
jgi:hypothetical protein